MTADILPKQNQPRPKVMWCSVIMCMEFKMDAYICHIYIYQYIIKNLEHCAAKVSGFLPHSPGEQLALSGRSVAVIKQGEADLGQSAQGRRRKHSTEN